MDVWRRRSAGSTGQDGVAAVEFALVMPLLVFFVFGIMQFGLYFYRYQGLQTMAHAGARAGAVGLTVAEVADRVGSAMFIPAEFADVEIDVILYDESTDTEVSRIDGKTVDTTEQDTALCEGLTNPRDYTLRVELSLDRTDGDYAIVIPLWGSVNADYRTVAAFGCEASS